MFDEKSHSLKMDKAIEVFSKELSSLRTGRANASMLDLIKVDVYGQQMPINQLGSITTPEARTLNIQVWDINNVPFIDGAIKKSNFSKTQIGIRPEFINFSKDGIPVKIKRVSNTGRHKIVDTECNGGNIKILSNASTEIPSESAHITFNQKYTYVYGDNWIIE